MVQLHDLQVFALLRLVPGQIHKFQVINCSHSPSRPLHHHVVRPPASSSVGGLMRYQARIPLRIGIAAPRDFAPRCTHFSHAWTGARSHRGQMKCLRIQLRRGAC